MNGSVLPVTCSLALASMSAAVVSHWWSFEEFGPLLCNAPQLATPHTTVTPPALPAPGPPDSRILASQAAPAPVVDPSAAQKEFYESLLEEMRQLKKTNLALRDQMAETNRDLMKLEFRVDTQSASFRPLPVTEEVSALDPSTYNAESVAIPPRAVKVGNSVGE
ncbi:MAG: hypothetical protein WCP45_14455 [Verrucomicrobiota bacterium]